MSGMHTPFHISDVRTVGIPVTDQDRAVDFYVGRLGFEVRLDGELGGGQRWIEVAPPGASTSIALMHAESASETGIDTQIRLTTRDAAADHAAMQSLGVDVDPEINPYPIPMFVFRDPDGNGLILVEVPEP